MIDIFIRLENEQCLHPMDTETLDKNMQRTTRKPLFTATKFIVVLHVDGLTFNGPKN